jgi:flavin reductase (DIM6/NTAB) family NADH-FMN oxidoreductase RutF
MMLYDPKNLDIQECYKLLIGSIVPRPIAWVSTIDNEGIVNVAPFSFFTGICKKPPMIGITLLRPHEGSRKNRRKDTLMNIEATREFVINVVTEELGDQMNLTSSNFPTGTSELIEAGLTASPSAIVRPPCIAESPISLECRLYTILEFGENPSNFIIGEVVQFHVKDELVENYRIDQKALRAIGRMGGPIYTRTQDTFAMEDLKFK